MGEFDKQLYEDIGYIRRAVEDIGKAQIGIDVRLRCVEKKMNRILGYATAVGAMGSFVVVFAKDWFKRFF